MKNFRIFVVLALYLLAHAHCRPEDQSEGYFEDTPQDDDDEDADQEDDKGFSGPPEIKSRPLYLEVKPGSTVEFPCATVNADDFAIQWKKDNVDLYLGETVLTQEPERIVLSKNNTLRIYGVTENDSSDHYYCQILAEPVIRITHSLRIVNNPNALWEGKVIRTFPSKVIEVNESESITFGCETKLREKPDFKWSHGGARLRHEEVIDGNYITIRQANRHHSGHYQCLADDGSLSPPHESIEVIVNYAPVIGVEHEIVHTGVGMTSEITCKIDAHPRANVTWLKNGKSIMNKKDKKLISEDKLFRTLVIERTGKHDLGNYTCSATNPMGEASKDIELTGKPAKPKFIRGQIDDEDTALTLKWHVQSFSPITQYLLEYRHKGDAEWKKEYPKVIDGKNNQFTVDYPLKNLSPGSYDTTLMAQNDFGWSPRSSIHTFRKEYASDESQKMKDGNSSAPKTRSFPVLATLLLVVASYLSTNF